MKQYRLLNVRQTFAHQMKLHTMCENQLARFITVYEWVSLPPIWSTGGCLLILMKLDASLKELSHATRAAAFEFAEGERFQRESQFFRRNPRLREEAIKRHGLRCIACRLDFGERYGSAGAGYIEIYHLNPLAERRDAAAGGPTMTSLARISHRRGMVFRDPTMIAQWRWDYR